MRLPTVFSGVAEGDRFPTDRSVGAELLLNAYAILKTMDDKNQVQNVEQPANIAPVQPTKSASQSHGFANFLTLINFILVLLFFTAAGAFGGYNYEHNKATARENDLNSQINSLEASIKLKESQESNADSLEATIPIGDMVDKTLDYLTKYKQQNGQFPEDETVDLLKITWNYNYNYKAGGPVLSCPQDSRFLAYNSLVNLDTHEYDTFTLYYCNGDKMDQKTQSDIE